MNLTLDPTEPAWATALVIFEALPTEAQRARFLLSDLSTFDAVMRAAELAGCSVRHAPGDRLRRAKPHVSFAPVPAEALR
jgi:hypothetical protein